MKLIQHDYLKDPWKMMVACKLLNMTSDKPVKQVAAELFEAFPTAIAMKDAQRSHLYPILRPLGLYNKRAEQLVKMSQDAYDGKVIGTWFGVGSYAIDSWMIFVCGRVVWPEDKELRKYLQWLEENKLYPPAFTAEDGRTHNPDPLGMILRLKEGLPWTPQLAKA